MSDNHDNHLHGDAQVLDRVIASVRDASVPDGPDDRTVAETLAALRAAEASTTIQTKRFLTMKNVIRLAVAACVAIAAGAAFWVATGAGGNLAFANVLEQVNQARTVRFKAQVHVAPPDQPEQNFQSTMRVAGNRLRQEMPDVVSVFDFTKGEVLTLMQKEKKAMRVTMKNMPPEAKRMNIIDQFRQFKADDSKDLGTKEIDGHKARGFQVEQPGQKIVIWADVKTRVPVRIETSMSLAAVPTTTAVMTDFVWDDPADAKEISLDPPAGYEVRTMTVDASPAAEKDMIESLRSIASFNGGEFPKSFDMAGLSDVMKKINPKTPAEAKAFPPDEMMSRMVKIGRGFQFVLPTNGEDWRYAGAGVKLDTADRAVLWYKPKGSQKYHVINADQSVHEATPDAMPNVESKPIAGMSFAAPATKPAAK
jgi:hypothetical protein